MGILRTEEILGTVRTGRTGDHVLLYLGTISGLLQLMA